VGPRLGLERVVEAETGEESDASDVTEITWTEMQSENPHFVDVHARLLKTLPKSLHADAREQMARE